VAAQRYRKNNILIRGLKYAPCKIMAEETFFLIDATWRKSKDCIGAVLLEEEQNHKFKAFIGVAHDGGDNQDDAVYIMNYGVPMSLVEAQAFFPATELTVENYLC
jgi:hypothetical protein